MINLQEQIKFSKDNEMKNVVVERHKKIGHMNGTNCLLNGKDHIFGMIQCYI